MLPDQVDDLAAVIDFGVKPPADGDRVPIYTSWYRMEINSDIRTAEVLAKMSNDGLFGENIEQGRGGGTNKKPRVDVKRSSTVQRIGG